MALPRNSRRTASIPTTDRPPAPATARWDEPKIILPPRAVIPDPACWLRGLRRRKGGPTASRIYMRRLCAVACLSARAQYASSQTRCEMTGDRSRTPIFPHPTGGLLMISIDGNWRAAAAALLLATGGSAMAGSLGGPLELQDEG